MTTPIASSFDAAFWFIDRAVEEGGYIQPQKLQRLLYLAQAYYAAAFDGESLMPAVFVADRLGPVEPGCYRLFESAIPQFERKPLKRNAAQFLDAVWRRFAHHSTEHLNRLIARHDPYEKALNKGVGTIIPLEDMVLFYGKKDVADKAGIPSADQITPPVFARTQTGAAVQVQKWRPPKKN